MTELQFLANFLVGHEASQDRVWDSFPDLFVRNLNRATQFQNVALMMLWNCVLRSETRLEQFARDEAQSKLLWRLMRLAPLPSLEADLFHWIWLLVCRLCSAGHLRTVWTSLLVGEADEWDHLKDRCNAEQLGLLKLLLAALEKQEVVPGERNVADLAFIASEFIRLSATLHGELRFIPGGPVPFTDFEAVLVLLEILLNLTKLEGPQAVALRTAFSELPLVQTLVALLKTQELSVQPQETTPPADSNAESKATEGASEPTSDQPTFGFRKSLIQLLANLSYRNRTCQDQVRECDGLTVLLNSFWVDKNNPFMREWAIFALRNLTEDNEENVNFIQSLEFQGTKSHPDLDALGLEAVITPAGKVTLRKK